MSSPEASNICAHSSGAANPDRMDALLICIPRGNAVGRAGDGDFLLAADGQITRGPGHVYGGTQVIKTDGLAAIPETSFSLNLLWNQIARDGRLFGLEYPGLWCDVGHPEGIKLAENVLEHGHV